MSSYKMIEKTAKSTQKKAWASLNKMQKLNLRSVIHYGFEKLGDIADHGADGGENGLTWTEEMRKRVKRHKVAMLEQIAIDCENMGMDIGEFLGSFRCWQHDTKTEILVDIMSGKFELAACGLCWYFAESGAQDFVSFCESEAQ